MGTAPSRITGCTLLIYAFVLFGPLGSFILPLSICPKAFRLFYMLLPLSPLFYTRFSPLPARLLQRLAPFMIYLLISCSLAQVHHNFEQTSDPLFRGLLLILLMLFVIGASSYLPPDQIASFQNRAIRLYLITFFISLLVGIYLELGFYLGKVSLDTIDRLSVQTQFGYGFLRISPFSYPNEYGLIASFTLATTTLLIAAKLPRHSLLYLPRPFLLLLEIFSLVALLLTTTRAAYLSFLLAIGYLLISSASVRRYCFSQICRYTLSLLLFGLFFINPFDLTVVPFQHLNDLGGSLSVRLDAWHHSLSQFLASPLLGNGFGTLIQTHNLYLQILFELGLLGSLLLLGALISFSLSYWSELKRFFSLRAPSPLPHQVAKIGLIHLMFFGLSNHNLLHHLTHFIILLTLLSLVELNVWTSHNNLRDYSKRDLPDLSRH